jgi:ribosomal protein S18 acetylase RimI-like enzyme
MNSETTFFDPHIRLIHLRTDLFTVADLVELCFADHMDAEGRAYLRHVRSSARDENSLYLDASSPETSQIPFHGYVWVENGKIIGNLTLICTNKHNQPRYFIANVAVHPDFRNQGIGRKLTMRALQHVRDHEGKAVILQVREDNPSAIHIYESLGFREINRRSTWVWNERPRHKQELPGGVKISQRRKEDWPQHKLWLEATYPEVVSWFLPFQMKSHEPGLLNRFMRWLDAQSVRFYSVHEDDKLIGVVSLESVNPFQDYLWIASSLAFEDRAIEAIVPYLLKRAKRPQKLLVNYPAHRAEESFLKSGMKLSNTLIWMENNLD